jgi:hypothetical protein
MSGQSYTVELSSAQERVEAALSATTDRPRSPRDSRAVAFAKGEPETSLRRPGRSARVEA